MRKIGILTFHNACNYGAVLQAYALKTALEKRNGVQADIVDYRNLSIEAEYSMWGNINWVNNPVKELIKAALCLPYRYRRNQKFACFCKEFLKTGNHPLSREKLVEKAEEYSSFVVGSDQIWNLDITNNDYTFFLDFVKDKTKCNSYAASIGKSFFSEEEKKKLISLLRSFRQISFREPELLSTFVPELPTVPMRANIDPVFLLNSNEWRSFSAAQKRKPYVLLFMTGSNPAMVPAVEFAKKLAEEKKLETVFLSDQDRWYKFRDWKHCGAATPQEFLALIDNAEYVVTNSFHATSFSILMHTRFFTETNLPRNGRVLNILSVAGLDTRRLENGVPVCETVGEIDWEAVETRLAEKRAKAYEYLNEL